MAVTNLDDFKGSGALFPRHRAGTRRTGRRGPVLRLADDAITEYVITVPAYPKRIEGRDNLAELYRGYGDTMVLDGTSDLAVHHDRETSVVVLEYTSHGRVVATGRLYSNRFVSITIRDRKIARGSQGMPKDPLSGS